MYILPTLSTFSLLMDKKELKLTFTFPSVTIFSVNGWLIQRSNRSKKGYDEFPSCLCFLE